MKKNGNRKYPGGHDDDEIKTLEKTKKVGIHRVIYEKVT